MAPVCPRGVEGAQGGWQRSGRAGGASAELLPGSRDERSPPEPGPVPELPGMPGEGPLCRAGPFLGHARGRARRASAGQRFPPLPWCRARSRSGVGGTGRRRRGSEARGGGAGRCRGPLRAQGTGWCHRRVTARPPGAAPCAGGGDGVGGTEEPQPPLCAPSRDRGVVGGQAGGLGGFCDRQEIRGLVWGIPR